MASRQTLDNLTDNLLNFTGVKKADWYYDYDYEITIYVESDTDSKSRLYEILNQAIELVLHEDYSLILR
jgi:hypothetical protein